MRNKILILTFLFFFFFLSTPSKALFWNNYLVRINGKTYTKEDFKKWWKYWKEPGMSFPKTPDPFINWILMSDEAKALGLDQEPSYKNKLRIFREVRSLMQLKYEEVDSKIDLSRRVLWQEYIKDYIPRLKIKALITLDEKEAQKWKNQIKSSKDFEKLFKELEPKGKARDFGWERPHTIPKELRQTILSAKPGEILGPLKHGKVFYILFVQEKLGPDEEDFRNLERSIAFKIKKRESARLTKELIQRLKKKYKVTVNKEAIEKIPLKGKLPEDLAKTAVLKINDQVLTGAQFQKLLQKEAKLRLGKNQTKEGIEWLKWRLINDSIAQTLTTWEALNRHYENKPPLKDVYEFYKKQRLTRELEEKIIWPQVKVTEEDVRQYYEEHKKDFTKPERVEIAVIRTQDQQLAREVYQRLKKGEDFFEVGKEILFHGARPERYKLEDLVPEMRKVLKRLRPGEISPIIKIKRGNNTWYCIVKLIRHYPEEVHPFKMVKESIRKSLAQEKFERLKQEYIAKLRARSKIQINEKAWQELRKEMEAKHEAKAR